MHGGGSLPLELGRLAEAGERIIFDDGFKVGRAYKRAGNNMRRIESMKSRELQDTIKNMSMSDAEIFIFADSQGISVDDAKKNYNDVARNFVRSGNEGVIVDAINNREISPEMGKLIRADNKTKADINYKMTYDAEANVLVENLTSLGIDPQGALREFDVLSDPNVADRDKLEKLRKGVEKSAIERSGVPLTSRWGVGKSKAGEFLEGIGEYIDPMELLDFDGYGADYTPVPTAPADNENLPPIL